MSDAYNNNSSDIPESGQGVWALNNTSIQLLAPNKGSINSWFVNNPIVQMTNPFYLNLQKVGFVPGHPGQGGHVGATLDFCLEARTTGVIDLWV